MKKILTVIIPTYNMEKYLDKCLTSLIIEDKELMKQLEVLVVIDGAKDRSSEIAHTYQDKYPETFIVIDKDNGNYGSCINRGLKEAAGKYIKILDADDSYDTTNLESLLLVLNSIDVDLVLSPFHIVNEFGQIQRKHTYQVPQGRIIKFDDYHKDLKDLEMHSVTYNRRVFNGINYYQTEGISYTDQEWVLYPVSNLTTVYYTDKGVYLYLVGREGQTVAPSVQKKSVSHLIKGCYSMAQYFEQVKNNLKPEKYAYFINKLTNRLYSIYSLLVVYKLDDIIAKEFDDRLKLCSYELWSLASSLTWKGTKWLFVKDWREHSYKVHLPIGLYFHTKASSIKHGIIGLIAKLR